MNGAQLWHRYCLEIISTGAAWYGEADRYLDLQWLNSFRYIPSPTLMRPSLALSPPSIYFSPFRSVESPRCDQPIWVTLLSSFSDRPFFKIITPSLFLPLYLSVARFRGSDRSRYSYDLWTNDPRGISPKDWPNRDSTPSCPSR